MELIYNWLLHNTGNEGNYYTILNSRHETMPNGTGYVSVMIRSSDFKVSYMLIYGIRLPILPTIQAEWTVGKMQQKNLIFGNQQQVIDYLSSGTLPESAGETNDESVQALVAIPAEEAGEITFPPE